MRLRIRDFSPRYLPAVLMLCGLAEAHASPLFDDDSVLELALGGPLHSLIDNKNDVVDQPFVLGSGDVDQEIKVRVRGNSRRRVCNFPPLRLDFGKDLPASSVFEGQRRLKLVTHCRENSASTAGLLKEYAAYRILNLISDASFRVRLVNVTYTDTDGRMKETSMQRYGFLIESIDEVAARLGGKPESIEAVSLNALDHEQAARVFVFQYLIGNTDWSLVAAYGEDSCCHNGALINVDSNLYFVAYDFDLSGLVNARYARPAPNLSISRVTQRVYRGYCIPEDAVRQALRDIRAHQDAILAVPGQVPGLTPKDVNEITKYLQDFFNRTGDEDKVAQSFTKKCVR